MDEAVLNGFSHLLPKPFKARTNLVDFKSVI